MSRFLMVDIGAGTMDVLYYDTRSDLHYKAVVKSPVRRVAEKAAAGEIDSIPDVTHRKPKLWALPVGLGLKRSARRWPYISAPHDPPRTILYVPVTGPEGFS